MADRDRRHYCSGAVPAVSALTAVSFALLMANILLVNSLPDAASDAAVGKRTLAVNWGARGNALLYLLIALLAHGWLAVGPGSCCSRCPRSGACCRCRFRWSGRAGLAPGRTAGRTAPGHHADDRPPACTRAQAWQRDW